MFVEADSANKRRAQCRERGAPEMGYTQSSHGMSLAEFPKEP